MFGPRLHPPTAGNSAGLNGGAISLDSYCYPGATVANSSRRLVGGTFANNTAVNGKGGAVFISLCPEDAISRPGEPIVGWTYHDNWTRFHNVTFAHNMANCPRCMGGALNIESGQTVISGCRFEHNQVVLLLFYLLSPSEMTADPTTLRRLASLVVGSCLEDSPPTWPWMRASSPTTGPDPRETRCTPLPAPT